MKINKWFIILIITEALALGATILYIRQKYSALNLVALIVNSIGIVAIFICMLLDARKAYKDSLNDKKGNQDTVKK